MKNFCRQILLFLIHLSTAIVLLVLNNNVPKAELTKIDADSNVFYIGKVDLVVLLIIVEFYTALFHLIYICNEEKSRFIEYSISSALMSFVVACLCNITDVIILVSVSFFQFITCIFGFLQDQHSLNNESNKYPFWLGFIPFSIEFAILIYYLVISSPPNEIYGIFTGIFIFYILFAVNMWSFIYKKPESCCSFENNKSSYFIIYDLLSLFSKVFLAYYLFFGVKNMDNIPSNSPTIAPTIVPVQNYTEFVDRSLAGANAYIVPPGPNFPPNCSGNDIQNGNCRYMLALGNIDSCKAICTPSSICEGFFYVSGNDRCFFQETINSINVNIGRDSYVKDDVLELCNNIN